MKNIPPITYMPIGHVENKFTEPVSAEQIREAESRIVVNPDLVEGLVGLNPGQRLLVIFHFHLSRNYELLQHPRGDVERPLRGVFSLRSPRRPNPIGETAVELIAIEENVLHVRGLDAISGSPVLDIKPVINKKDR